MSKLHRTGCLVCGAELAYQTGHDDLECFLCHRIVPSTVKCREGHFVCDRCHSLSGNDFVEEVCVNSTSRDPMELVRVLMNSAKVPMHGPEHHFIVPAALLTAYYNIKGDPEQKRKKIKEARARSSNILGGFCGYYGDCGAAVGTGIFVSLITDSTPLSTREWRLSNTVTAKSLLSVAIHGGPRCCKRNTWLSITEAVNFLKENLHMTMKIEKDTQCHYSALNKECLKDKCLYYSKRDVFEE